VAETEVVVVGGGVVGLAAAAALARVGRQVVLLERGAGLGRETTARNSEVVHAGIYYPEGSWKARLCVRGRELLYERCAREGIPHRKLGKWIVACEESERERLSEFYTRGTANGAPGLRLVDRKELARHEPDVRAVAALESPETGIVDGGALCLSLAAEAESCGATIVLHGEVTGIEPRGAGYRVTAGEGGVVDAPAVVNAAGLWSDRIALLAGIDVDARGYRLHPCKGDYFALAPSAPLRPKRLIYPVPGGPGLGIHVTLDLGGRVRFGPDAHFVSDLDYDVDATKADDFAQAAARYLPGLRAEWLTPDFAGIRPRLAGPGEPPRDFVVCEESDAGLSGFVNLLGIESPGLTAALAIGEQVVGLLRGL